uniref:Chloride channel protein n=1 Tax=Ditylum brightwellii TaxID=49249 RepID=A0A7S4R3D3_9STRA|mmetsp:Transcript_20768/g.27324  ORF Transcript_20768/g.27324 Transcript_20768/m.27324 type:complete len:553 (-) Transcript_20768:251-1909(-)
MSKPLNIPRIEQCDTEEETLHSNGIGEEGGESMYGTMKELSKNGPGVTFGDTPKPMLGKVHSSFWEDLKSFAAGTIPQSIILAISIGIVCGVAAYFYYIVLFGLLDFTWHWIPEKLIIGKWPEELYVMWIPIVGFLMAAGVGFSVVLLGEPGDLAYTIKCVHEKAYISMSHVMPMVAASQFSILGGGSLGPEAPLVAICAALGGFVSRKVFKQRNRNVVRKHTLMGMAGALAAFFGCPLGGSLFALEVNSRMGVEYFEHMLEAIFCGEVCLAVFRGLSGLPIEPIWSITAEKLEGADPLQVIYGAFVGLCGAFVAFLFAMFHSKVMAMYAHFGLLDNKHAVKRALSAAVVIITLGMLIPQTMFWGEFEFQQISTMAPASELDHIWPTYGLIGFEMDTAWKCLIVGFAKLVAISFTVAGGYRGGFIFPFFAAGAALGRALQAVVPIPVSIATLCFAAGINVAITRTSLATTLILSYLAGEQSAITAILSASLCSLFATGYMPFIKTQIVRSDINSSLYYDRFVEPEIEESIRSWRGLPSEDEEIPDDEEDNVV